VDVYRRWRKVTDEYGDRVLVGEVFLAELDKVARFVGRDRLHQAFNFPLLAAPFEAAVWRDLITESLAAFAVDGASPTWVLSNHDVVRHPTRYGGGSAGRERALAATLTLLALPGAPYLYEGEELGLEQDDVPPELRQDPIWMRSKGAVVGRDGCRTPMPWTAEAPGHGFTSGTPWLPFGPQAEERNVAVEDAEPSSTLALYRQALALRREHRADLDQRVRWLDLAPDLLGFARTRGAGGALLCVLNPTDTDRQVDLPATAVLLASGPGVSLDPQHLHLPPRTAGWLLSSQG
jgi:alpha-glucosidase